MEKTDYISNREILGLTEAADGELRTAIFLACFAGLRFNEIVRLEWQDIDWARKVIRVSSLKTPEREIPIHPALEQRLVRWRGERVGMAAVIDPARAGRRLRSKLKRLGAALGAGLGFYDFRRWFVQVIAAEVGEKALADLCGHASRSIQLEYLRLRRHGRRRKTGSKRPGSRRKDR